MHWNRCWTIRSSTHRRAPARSIGKARCARVRTAVMRAAAISNSPDMARRCDCECVLAELDDSAFAPRRRRRVGELLRLHTIVDRRAQLVATGEDGEKMPDLVRVGGTVAFEEEMLGQIATHRLR